MTLDMSLLTPDCEKCASLCCVALAFDKSDWFPLDKPNGEPCPQLDSCGQCKVYEERDALGYRGCLSFNCLGAGQRTTQEVFKGRSWMSEPALLSSMTDSFVVMRRIHEQLQLLQQASGLPLTAEEQDVLNGLLVDLTPPEGWTEAALDDLDQSALERRVAAFLMSLRHHVA